MDLTDLFGGMARTGTAAEKQQLWCQPLHLAQVIGVIRQVPKKTAVLGFWVPPCEDLCSLQVDLTDLFGGMARTRTDLFGGIAFWQVRKGEGTRPAKGRRFN